MNKMLSLRKISVVCGILLLASVALLSTAPVVRAAGKTGYQITRRTFLGGEGTWDYLTFDQQTRQLFLARRGPGITVFNVDKNKVEGLVPETSGVSGVALVKEFNRGYATISNTSQVKAFDLKTLAPLAAFPVGEDPDGIIYDPASKLVFSMNGSGSTTVINPETNTLVKTIPLPSKKVEYCAVDGKGHLYINLRDQGKVAVVDTKTLTVDAIWSLNKAAQNTPMAIDTAKDRLFVGCRNGYLTIFNTKDGSILQELPILGFNCDSIVYDPETRLIFVANTNANITIYQENAKGEFAAVDTIYTQPWAKTMALDAKNHTIYIAGAQTGKFIPKQTWPELIPNTFEVMAISRK